MEFNVKGFILREQSYKENDKIIKFICKELGKISILARSVKKNTSTFFAITQPFRLVQLNLRKGKSFYYIIDGSLIKNLDFIGFGDMIFYLSYFFELIDICFLENEPIRAKFFEILIRFFLFFEVSEIDKNLVMRIFELKILEEIGCNFEFEYCYYCSKKIKDKYCYFDFSLQNVVCNFCSKLKEFKIENRIINTMRFLSTINVMSMPKIKVNDEDIKLIFDINKVFLEQNIIRMPNSIRFLGGYNENG